MLSIYSQLFTRLNNSNITYSIFKGLDHLDDDLNGQRGDIDIWVKNGDVTNVIDIAGQNNFFTVKWSSVRGNAFILIGWDIALNKFVMLHVHVSPFAQKKKSFLPLYFRYLDNPIPVNKEMLKKPSLEWVKEFETNRDKIRSQSDLKLIYWTLLGRKHLKDLGFKFSPKETLTTYISYFQRFLIYRGRYRITRKGVLIALMGVDGSGKSSTITMLSNSSFLGMTLGIKRYYFGNNEYWIPGLNKILRKANDKNSNKLILVLLKGLSLIDVKLRIIPAIISKLSGKFVIADRYYYDHQIDPRFEKYIPSKFVKNILKPFVFWVPRKPDCIIYLKIDAATAFNRKREHTMTKMKRICKAYDNFFLKNSRISNLVVCIDASQEQAKVELEIRNEILKTLNATRN